jgi:hypothetical protein
MPDVAVNYYAVLFAAILAMILGFVWYGPLFGKAWMQLVGITEKDMNDTMKNGMAKTYLMMMVAALVMAYVLAIFSQIINTHSLMAGITLGFWVWLGFVATSMFSSTLFSNKPMKLFVIEAGYYLTSLVIMGAVLSLWT